MFLKVPRYHAEDDMRHFTAAIVVMWFAAFACAGVCARADAPPVPAAVADIVNDNRSRAREEPLRMLDAFDLLLGRLGQCIKTLGQSFDLLGVEDGVFLEERNLFLDLLSVFG